MSGREATRVWQIWKDVTPLILDAFTMHIWATPFTARLRQYAGGSTGSEFFVVITVVLIAVLTFTVNLATIKNAELLHNATRVSESPLFRTAFLFAASATIARCISGAGVLTFTVVTFIPLVYVRVPSSIPVVSAVYATVYFLCAFIGTMNNTDTLAGVKPHEETSYFTNILVWLCFALSSVHHAAWHASHSHYSPSRGRFASDRDPDSVSSLGMRLYEHIIQESTQLAAYRTMVVLGCMLLRSTDSTNTGPVAFIERLALLVTVSTFASFAHGQHTTRGGNSLSSVLLSTVAATSCGMLVENVEQVACILVATPLAIAFELASVRRRLAALVPVKRL
jgi:hypothetical protein